MEEKKNRWLKRLAAAVMTVMMIAVTVPTGVLADHPAGNRTDGGLCNNTYRTYTHAAYVTNMSEGAHLTSEGVSCLISHLVYEHRIFCSVCGYEFPRQSIACTTIHSKCGTRIVNH